MEYSDEELSNISLQLLCILDYYTDFADFKVEITYNPNEALPYFVKIVNTKDEKPIGGCKSNDLYLALDGAKDSLKDYVFEKTGTPQSLSHVIMEDLGFSFKKLKNNEATGSEHSDGSCP